MTFADVVPYAVASSGLCLVFFITVWGASMARKALVISSSE